MFPRNASERLHFDWRDGRTIRIRPAPRIKHLEDGQTYQLLGLEIVLSVVPRRDKAPALLPDSTMDDVVLGPSLGIAEDLIGFAELAEPTLVARFSIVRVIPLSKETIDTMNRLRLRVRADLKNFVKIRTGIRVICIRQHALPPGTPAPQLSAVLRVPISHADIVRRGQLGPADRPPPNSFRCNLLQLIGSSGRARWM